MRYRSAWACRSAIYVRWAQKKGALVARPSGGAEVVPARGALFRPESAGREGQRRLLLIIPALAASRLGRNEQLKAFAPSNTSSFPRRVSLASFRGAGTRISASRCPGTGSAREPGIHTHGLGLWSPALAAIAARPE